MSSEQPERPSAPAGSSGPGAVPADPAAADPTVVGPAAQVPRGGLGGPLAVYSLLRLGLIVVLTAALSFFMPLIVALLFAIIVQLPLAYLLFSGPRKRVNAAMAASSAHRRAERERLRAALSGEAAPPDRPAG